MKVLARNSVQWPDTDTQIGGMTNNVKGINKASWEIFHQNNSLMENALFTNSAVSVRKLHISIRKIKLRCPWLFFCEEKIKLPRAL